MRQALKRSDTGTTYIAATGHGHILTLTNTETHTRAEIRDTDYEDGMLIATLLTIDIENADLAAAAHEAQATHTPITYEAQWWPNGTQKPGTPLDLATHGDTILTNITLDRIHSTI